MLARQRAGSWRADTRRTLHALRVLARVAAALDAGVEVVRPSAWSTMARALDTVPRQVVQGWLVVAAGCTSAVVLTAAVGANAGLVVAVPVGILAWGVAAVSFYETRTMVDRDRSTIARAALIAAWSLLVGGGTLMVMGALVRATEWVVSPAWDRTVRALVATAVATAGWVVFAVSPITARSPVDVTSRALAVLVGATGAATGAVALAPLVLSPHPVWSGWAPTMATLAGLLIGFVVGALVGDPCALPLCRLAFALAGEPDPWRRGLLRFAADRSLLSFVDTEYRFVHLLVRDHLAGCDPAILADAVAIRRDQLAQRA